MALLKQNRGAKAEPMKGKNTGGEAKKPASNTGTVKFDSTVARSNTVAGVTKPTGSAKGSHDDKSRTHGGED